MGRLQVLATRTVEQTKIEVALIPTPWVRMIIFPERKGRVGIIHLGSITLKCVWSNMWSCATIVE